MTAEGSKLATAVVACDRADIASTAESAAGVFLQKELQDAPIPLASFQPRIHVHAGWELDELALRV